MNFSISLATYPSFYKMALRSHPPQLHNHNVSIPLADSIVDKKDRFPIIMKIVLVLEYKELENFSDTNFILYK
jgi:hypothetical protein